MYESFKERERNESHVPDIDSWPSVNPLDDDRLTVVIKLSAVDDIVLHVSDGLLHRDDMLTTHLNHEAVLYYCQLGTPLTSSVSAGLQHAVEDDETCTGNCNHNTDNKLDSLNIAILTKWKVFLTFGTHSPSTVSLIKYRFEDPVSRHSYHNQLTMNCSNF